MIKWCGKWDILSKKTIFPNIELRLDQSSNKESEELNIHIIFDNLNILINKIESFLNNLPTINRKADKASYFCNSNDLSELGYKKACVNIDTVLTHLNIIFGDEKPYMIFGVANGYGGIRPDEKSPRKIGIAEELDKNCDAFFARSQDKDFFMKTDRFPEAEKKPIVSGSDSHSFEDLENTLGKKYISEEGVIREVTWIKADHTFEGLKQITYEPESRVYIGDIPEKLQKIKENPQLYIKSLKITSKTNEDEWFDDIGQLKLNPDLVAIIGNKGSGKSALVDIISMVSNCENDNFSFLNAYKFLSLQAHKKYSSELQFNDNKILKKFFSKPECDENLESYSIYLCQDFIQKLCESEKIDDLQKEIDRVIFKKLSEKEKKDSDNLSELISSFSSIINKEIVNQRNILYELNKNIIKYEKYLNPMFKDGKQRKLKEKQDELKRLESEGKPDKVQKPTKILNEEVATKIEELKSKYKNLLNIDDEIKIKLSEKTTDKTSILQIIQQIDSISNQIESLKKEIDANSILKKYKITSIELSLISPKSEALTQIINNIENDILELTQKKKDNLNSKKTIENNIKELQSKISAHEKEYQNYLEKLEKWENKKKEIIGDKNKSNSIINLESWINFIEKEAQQRLEEIINDRNIMSNNIGKSYYKKMLLIENIYSSVKDYAREILESAKIDKKEFIDISSGISLSNNFEDNFLSFINQKRKGTYTGILSGKKQFRKLIASINLNNENELLNLPKTIINSLEYDYSSAEKKELKIDVEEQLIDPTRKEELYNLIYSYKYLETRAEIIYSGKRLRNLSPGEKGTVLLIFFLLIDKDRRPIIIDQPEENLDNETVYKILVPLIKRVKSERQVIIVTHNPNLAVVADAEQIIRCYIDKKNNNKISYVPGSIEYHKIRESVINVLEGTKDAFKNRRNKYGLKD